MRWGMRLLYSNRLRFAYGDNDAGRNGRENTVKTVCCALPVRFVFVCVKTVTAAALSSDRRACLPSEESAGGRALMITDDISPDVLEA